MAYKPFDVVAVHNPGFIPEDIQLQIFQRSFSTKGSGRGLGTYSIKLLTERYLKGRVSFETSLEAGTVFRAFCPNLALEEMPLPHAAPSQEKKSRSLHILIAEDNPVNQKLMRRMIEKQGHSAVVAGNGKEALDALAHEPFDLVLMDCQMPEMDGFEAAEEIRKSRQTRNSNIPIVAMTGHTDGKNREACLAAGMNDHVSSSSTTGLRFRTSFPFATPLAMVSRSATTSAALIPDSFMVFRGSMRGLSSGRSSRSSSG